MITRWRDIHILRFFLKFQNFKNFKDFETTIYSIYILKLVSITQTKSMTYHKMIIFLNLTHLFHRNMTDKFVLLSKILSSDPDNISKLTLEHRLQTIKNDIHVPMSLLLLDDFSVFSKTYRYKTDYIFRFLYFANNLGISLARPLPAPQSLELQTTHHTPIYKIFADNPIEYAKNIYYLSKHSIMYLSDCMSDDGLIILPYKDIIKKNSRHAPSSKTPKWYKFIISNTAVGERSLRLQDKFTERQRTILYNQLTAPSISSSPLNTFIPASGSNWSSSWCALWNNDSNSPIFGRVFKNSPNHMTIQHWIRTIDVSASVLYTPQSQKLHLSACQGCHLNNPHSLNIRVPKKPCKRTGHLPCVFMKEHFEVVNLKEFLPYNLNNSNTLNITYFHMIHLILDTLLPALTPGIPDHINPDDALLECKPQYGVFFRNSSSFIPVTSHLRTFVKSVFNAQNFNNLLSLKRWSFISFLNNSQAIDWKATWFLFKNHHSLQKSKTSFAQSTHQAFSFKLLMDELPIFSKLQSTRRPDIYNSDWNCFLCHNDKEPCTHIGQCPILNARTEPLCNSTKLALEDLVINSSYHNNIS